MTEFGISQKDDCAYSFIVVPEDFKPLDEPKDYQRMLLHFMFCDSYPHWKGIFTEFNYTHGITLTTEINDKPQEKWNWLAFQAMYAQSNIQWALDSKISRPSADTWQSWGDSYRHRLEEHLKTINSRLTVDWDDVFEYTIVDEKIIPKCICPKAFDFVDKIGFMEFLLNPQIKVVSKFVYHNMEFNDALSKQEVSKDCPVVTVPKDMDYTVTSPTPRMSYAALQGCISSLHFPKKLSSDLKETESGL